MDNATVAAIVGHDLAKDEAEDSYSILPAMLGEARDGPIREALVHHSLDGTFAIRQGEWKLIFGNLGSGGFTHPRNVSGDGQLYHLADDPAETANVYAEHPEVVQRLTALLNRYRKSGRSGPPD